MFTQPAGERAHILVNFPAKGEGSVKGLRRRLAASHRSPDKGHGEQSQKTGYPVVDKGDMVDQVKLHCLMQAPREEIDADLPEVVVEVHPALAPLPEACPAGEVKIDPVDIGQGLLLQGFLDHLPVVGPGDDPHPIGKAGDLPNPVPAYSRL